MALVVVFHASPDEFHETYYRPLLIGTGILACKISRFSLCIFSTSTNPMSKVQTWVDTINFVELLCSYVFLCITDAIAIIVLSLTLIVSGVAIVMGFVLIKASNEVILIQFPSCSVRCNYYLCDKFWILQRKTRYLRWWIIYAIICIIWGIFATIINDGENIAIAVVRCVLLLCLYSFGIWVVRVHIQEIDGYRVTSPY